MTKKLVFFDDLDDKAKEKAREWFRSGSCDDDMGLSEILRDYITTELENAGYIVTKGVEVLYSLGSSQGDGVSFTATLEKGNARYFVTQSGRYVHEMTMDMECESLEDFVAVDCDGELEDMRAIARKAVKIGYQEIEYQTSDEVVDETIRVNEYTFTLEGERINPDKE